MFDVTKPEAPMPVLFFFDRVEVLRDYEAFTVEPTTIITQGRQEFPAFSVVAKHRFTPNRGPVAQFEHQQHADLFRDMAEIVAAHV